MVSKDGKFELGFFSPGNSMNYYIGIWYKDIPTQTVVWVANRDTPIPYASYLNSVLAISNGSPVLYNHLKSVIWFTISTIENSNATEAVLLDTGNLVLRNRIAVAWQSFDYPTDTWLPGGKVGFDNNTNRSLFLTSWRNTEDPSTGHFSTGMNPDRRRSLIHKNGSQEYWSSVWNGQTFSFLSELYNNYLYKFSYISTDHNHYFTYNVSDESVTTRFLMDSSGQIRQLVWFETIQEWSPYWTRPVRACEVYGYCGSFGICDSNASPICSCLHGFEPRSGTDWVNRDYFDGCVRTTPLICNSNKEGFLKVNNIKLPANSESRSVLKVQTCLSECRDNCSCLACAFNNFGGFSLLMDDLVGLEKTSRGGDLFLRLDASDLIQGHSGSKIRLRVSLAVSGALAFIICCSIFFYLFRSKLNRKGPNAVKQNLLLFELEISSKSNSDKKMRGEKEFELPMFSFSSISAATSKFSEVNKVLDQSTREI